MPTAAPFHQIEECHSRQTGPLADVIVVQVIEKTLVQLDVGPRVKEHTVAGQAIAPGTTDLLIPRLDVLRHVAVNDESHIRLVDAHSKRDRGDHDVDIVALKRLLIARPFVGLEAGVIGERTDALPRQELRRLFHAFAALAIHNATLVGMRANEREHFRAGVAALPFLARRDLEIGPEERPLEARRFPHAELSQNIQRDASGRRRGQREHGHIELLLETLQASVRRTEIVSPLADAVRLIHHEQRDGAAAHEVAEVAVERFGREEHQFVRAGSKRLHARATLVT